MLEPAYDWSRQRRRLDEEGRTSASPDFDQLLWSWLSLFEFFSYGMYAGGKQETQVLIREMVENGIEQGYREYQNDNLQTYREVEAELRKLIGREKDGDSEKVPREYRVSI